MIISDTYKFCFIHIPKCAGSSVRSALAPYDDRNNYYWMEGCNEWEGVLHRAHLTPSLMRREYQGEFERIESYQKFAIVRDPKSRFLSSFKQYLITNALPRFEALNSSRIERELMRAIDRIASGEALNPWLVHFTPQTDFVYDGDRLYVSNLFPVERLDLLYKWINDIVGDERLILQNRMSELENVSFAYKNSFLRHVFGSIQPFARYIMPAFIRKPVGRMVKTKPVVDDFPAFNSRLVQDFINDYYCDDFRLRRAVRAGYVPTTRSELTQWSAP